MPNLDHQSRSLRVQSAPPAVPEVDDAAAVAARLRAARRAAGKTQMEAAERIGVARTTVVAIEKGQRSIRPAELTALAEYFRRPVSELLRPLPVADDFVTAFRASASRELVDDEVMKAVSTLQELADDYVELERISGSALPQQYPPERPSRALKPVAAGEALASAERNRLGLGDGPVLEIRQLLESDVGLRVFGLDLPSRVAGLYIGSTVYGSCMAFHVDHDSERQRWTMAHGFGLFLAHRSTAEVIVAEVDERPPARVRFAEAFAENFLMPAAGVMRRFHEIERNRPGGATPVDLMHLADRFQVGVQPMKRRLRTLGLTSARTWERPEDERFEIGESPGRLAGEPSRSQRQALPLRYRCLAVEAYLRGDLSEGQLARFLRVDRVQARRVVARAEQSPISEIDPLDTAS